MAKHNQGPVLYGPSLAWQPDVVLRSVKVSDFRNTHFAIRGIFPLHRNRGHYHPQLASSLRNV